VRYDTQLREAACIPYHPGPMLVLFPRDYTAADGFHEVGHVVCCHGLAAYLRGAGASLRHAERVRGREEREANDVMLAFLLPAWLVNQAKSERDLQELAETSGIPLDVVKARRQALRGRHFFLTAAPRWSAWWHLEVWRCGRRFEVRPKGGGPGPRWDIPGRPGELDLQAWELNVDLMALSPDEWAIRAAAFGCEEGAQRVPLDLREAVRRLERRTTSPP
jgi:hypothetical protein